MTATRAPQMAGRAERILRASVRSLRRRSSALDRAGVWIDVHRSIRRDDPVLIFSIGKTGTTSLTGAIETTGRGVLKAHALTPSGIGRRLQKERRLELTDRPRFLWATQYLAWYIRRRPGHRWEIICGVRDPIALAVSDHFYGLQLQQEMGVRPERRIDDPSFHRQQIEAGIGALWFEEDWFRDELLTITGIDVFAHPFPHDQGWAIYRNDRFHMLLMRFEDLPRAAPHALQTFLELEEPPSIPRANVGGATTKGSLYNRFLDAGGLERDLIDRVYATDLAQHFYTRSERETFTLRWLKTDCPDV